MPADIQDLLSYVIVVKAGGFREGARASGKSASSLSDAVRRIEARLGVRLLNRTTRSVMPTEAGARLMERIVPALAEVETSLDVVNDFRDGPSGTLKLNVPASAARLVLPQSSRPFCKPAPTSVWKWSSKKALSTCSRKVVTPGFVTMNVLKKT